MGDYSALPLNSKIFTIVDTEDVVWLSQWKWSASPSRNGIVYARRKEFDNNRMARNVLLHRLILNAPPNLIVDHINGDSLDNRKSNLRLCRQAENVINRRKTQKETSNKYKGVCQDGSRWRAYISHKKKLYHLGMFSSEELAAIAYNNASEILHGAFGCKNIIGRSCEL